MNILAVSRKRILAFGTLALMAWTVSVRGQSAVVAKLGAKLTAPASPPSLQVKVVDLIPASLSGETNQDSEPFLAIQTANPQIMVASAFTPNPVSKTGNAPVYVSQDGGNSWVLNAITPVQSVTCDITHAMAAGDVASHADRKSTRLNSSHSSISYA